MWAVPVLSSACCERLVCVASGKRDATFLRSTSMMIVVLALMIPLRLTARHVPAAMLVRVSDQGADHHFLVRVLAAKAVFAVADALQDC